MLLHSIIILHCVSGWKEAPSKYQVYITPGSWPGFCSLATVEANEILYISSQSTHRPSSRQGAYQLFREGSLEKPSFFPNWELHVTLLNEAHISYGIAFLYAKYSDISTQEAFWREKKKKSWSECSFSKSKWKISKVDHRGSCSLKQHYGLSKSSSER